MPPSSLLFELASPFVPIASLESSLTPSYTRVKAVAMPAAIPVDLYGSLRDSVANDRISAAKKPAGRPGLNPVSTVAIPQVGGR